MSSRLSVSLANAFSTLRITPTVPAVRNFSTTPAQLKKKIVRVTFNPHALAASKKRREANVSRQRVLQKEREAAAVDPVLGRETEFLKSLDVVPPPLPSVDAVQNHSAKLPSPEQQRLNHFLANREFSEFMSKSRSLADPYYGESFQDDDNKVAFQAQHEHSVEAIRRIISLSNGNSGDRTRANKQMVINLFGRHTTDSILPKDPSAPATSNKTPRAGPDTGSSEVQAAILTVKIRALAKAITREDGFETKDKHNKRNLRLMVHRRQKLLKYLKRKEKGGIRYRNIMDALGLDDAAVEKELFL
ncbi:hypothetical protein BZA77DRAFT_39133 [Pyronema omphalodes]|nr:hypothetical protein BZA77DRAFT_39133 [Pyronema omphalodes]